MSLDGGDLAQIKEMIRRMIKEELNITIKLHKSESQGVLAEVFLF